MSGIREFGPPGATAPDRAIEVLVVPTGTANTASVLTGLRRLGGVPRLVASADEIEDAPAVVLPGVGAFGAAMQRLREGGFVEPLRARLLRGAPTLAICLGLQLLGEESEESPGVAGLGVIPARVTRFGGGLPVPHMGWNRVEVSGARFLRGGFAYFANSFRLTDAPVGWTAARTSYGDSFVAALERDGVLACQFHPELSGPWGRELLGRWLAAAEGSVAALPAKEARGGEAC